jgi:hypothetical protein
MYCRPCQNVPIFCNAPPSPRPSVPQIDAPVPMGVAEFLEPTAPTVPATATDNEQHDDNDQKCRGVHVLFSIGYPYRNSHPFSIAISSSVSKSWCDYLRLDPRALPKEALKARVVSQATLTKKPWRGWPTSAAVSTIRPTKSYSLSRRRCWRPNREHRNFSLRPRTGERKSCGSTSG